MSLKGRVLNGSLWSLAGGSGQQLISFLIFLYLARQLSPSAVGIVAFAAILLDIVSAMARLGLVEALQRQEPDIRVESTLFLVLLGTGLAGMAILLAGAGVTWLVSADPHLVRIFCLLSPIALFTATSALPEGVIRRRMDYRALTVRTWIGTLLGGLVAIAMVHWGFGLYALVGQRLASAAMGAVLLWAQAGWRPAATVDLPAARETLRTGMHILVAGMSGLLNGRIADAVTGGFLGAASLGFLRIGWRFTDILMQMTVTPVAGVALPSFARLRDDPVALGRAYLRLTQFMAVGALPTFFGLGAVSAPFIQWMLGPKWAGAQIVFELLGLLMTAGAVNYFFAPIMVAIGRADIVMKQSVAQVLASIPLLVLGASFGLVGVLLAHIARSLGVGVFNILCIRQQAGVPARKVVGMILPAAISSAVMFLAVRWILSISPSSGPLLQLAGGMVIGAAVYAAVLVGGDLLGLWPHYVRGAFASLADGFRNRTSEA